MEERAAQRKGGSDLSPSEQNAGIQILVMAHASDEDNGISGSFFERGYNHILGIIGK